MNTNITKVVPDIYQRSEIKDGWIMLVTDLKNEERVKIIKDNASKVYQVSAVEEGRYKVSGKTAHLFSLDSQFVYGREVDDFHTVDCDAITMLSVSATQEQQKIIEKLQEEIELLKS